MCLDLTVERPLDLEEACPRWRWVALRGDGKGCPEPEPVGDGVELVAKPLFSALPGAPVPAPLARYCIYELQYQEPPGKPPFEKAEERLEELVEEGHLQEFDSDCMALAPTATLSDQIWDDLERQFTVETSHPASLPTSALHTFGKARGGRLVLLDTQPEKLWEQGRQGRSRHGYSLGHMARSLLCATSGEADYKYEGEEGAEIVQPESCLVRVEHRLAMPIIRFDNEAPPVTLDSPTLLAMQNLPPGTVSDPIFGGYFGSLYELSAAIWETVAERWAAGDEEPLVLNLSLGWNGHLFGGHERRVEQMPVPVQAVYRALEVASCSGALVVAAAGNRAGGPQDGTGPLLPAAWEPRPAPGERQCHAFRTNESAVTRHRPPTRGGEEPLLYAAAGVTAANARLANARPRSLPPRVAFADHAVVRAPRSRQPTAIMTGSSVSAAVVSATAAAVWSLRPDLSRRELMELLEKSGQSLELESDFRFAGWGRRVHRVLFCQALRKACGGHRQCSGWSGECAERESVKELAQSFQGAASSFAKKKAAPSQKTTLEAPFCGIDELISDGTIPIDLCPSRQFHGILTRPWTGPQPQDTPCPSCGIPPPQTQAFSSSPTTTTELYIEIEDWAGQPLANGMLQVGQTLIALDLPNLSNGDSIVVTGLDWNLFTGSPPPPVLLIFNTPDGSVEVPVLVVQSGTTF